MIVRHILLFVFFSTFDRFRFPFQTLFYSFARTFFSCLLVLNHTKLLVSHLPLENVFYYSHDNFDNEYKNKLLSNVNI